MSLNYDLTEVLGRNKIDNETLQAIIFITMAVGLGEITEKNYKEFFERVKIVETVCGPVRSVGYLALEDIQKMVGLKTNVFPTTSRKKFEANMSKSALQRMIRDREKTEKG